MPAKSNSQLSSKMRDYLAEIYRLIDRQTQPSEYLTPSQLADHLLVSPPAINRMVNRLSSLGMLHHIRYQGIAITDKGRQQALLHIRKQRIAETFLVKIMGISWLNVHQEAIRLSSGLSDAVTQRMYDMASKPLRCPHGEHIPDQHGNLPPARDTPLSTVPAGQQVRISRLTTREFDRLQYIEALGLTPNQKCEVIHVAPFDGPMQLKLKREYRIIGHSLAQLIRVIPLP